MTNLFNYDMRTNILNGDVRYILPNLPDNYFDCVVTSPPYWGLRDYGVEGQIGMEATPTIYLETMVSVCRELRRVLKPEGTFWLNIGDSYVSHKPRAGSTFSSTLGDGHSSAFKAAQIAPDARSLGYKNKDLLMIPNRLAILLQEDGWYVRSEIIWHKPNPMPESVKDRPTSAHEKVWLLTKSEKYFYDADAIRESFSYAPIVGLNSNYSKGAGKIVGSEYNKPVITEGKNARNVWSISPKPFKGAHFATMPPELAERCIKAGCPVGGDVLDPFGGAGTTGLVANQLLRNATLIELNTEYIDIAQQRISAAE